MHDHFLTTGPLPGVQSSSSPTKYYEYNLDGVAPEHVKVTQKGVPDIYGYSYMDGLGRTVQSSRPAESSSLMIVQDTFYDSLGRVNKTSVPYFSTVSTSYSDPAGAYFLETSYDPLGRVLSVTNPDGTSKSVLYDHWVVNRTDETGSVISNHLDAFGQIVRVVEYNGDDIYNTRYNYSGRGELTRIEDHEGNIFNFSYDSLGRKVEMDDPDMGTWSYSYDNSSNLVGQIDNKSSVTNFIYDALDRLLNMNVVGTGTYNYTYDTQLNGTLYEIDNPYDTYRYGYDSRLRKTSEEHIIDDLSFTTRGATTPWIV